MEKIHQPRHRIRKQRQRRPQLRWSPDAWAKLLYLRDRGPTEVGGFGITTADDLLLVRDVVLIPQRCTETFVAFEDAAVADFFDEQIDQGLRPEQFARIWIHTHPGNSPRPSTVDEETFERVFGICDWSVMFILARGGRSFAELNWRPGHGSIRLKTTVDFTTSFAGDNPTAWEAEYQDCVTQESIPPIESDDLWLDDELDEIIGQARLID